MGDVTTMTNQGTGGTDNAPADDQANANADQGQQAAAGGKTNSEKRFEFGVFFRVHTETETPPGYQDPPLKPPSG